MEKLLRQCHLPCLAAGAEDHLSFIMGDWIVPDRGQMDKVVEAVTLARSLRFLTWMAGSKLLFLIS